MGRRLTEMLGRRRGTRTQARCERSELPPPDPSIHGVGLNLDERGPKQLELLEHFGLRRDSSVLEIGCGIGRLAYELAGFLDAEGRYTGFDIAPQAIAWLNANYAPRLPGFSFDLIDVENPRFHPDGRIAPDAVRFPYADASFDLVCAYEVLMHVGLAGVQTYLAETRRVLRPGGVAVLSFQAIWERENEPVVLGRPFVAIGGGVYSRFPESPEDLSMGYGIGLLRDLFRAAGLEPVAEVEGLWHAPWAARAPGPVHNCDLFALQRPSAG